MTKVQVVNNIQPRARRRQGQVIQPVINGSENHNAALVRNESIRIYGVYCGKPYDITFKRGDWAEYDSFNLKYIGEITGITDKGVTIRPRYGDRTVRLDLHKFCYRNYKFNLAEVEAHNHTESMCI